MKEEKYYVKFFAECNETKMPNMSDHDKESIAARDNCLVRNNQREARQIEPKYQT